jgi:hypothetical protein
VPLAILPSCKGSDCTRYLERRHTNSKWLIDRLTGKNLKKYYDRRSGRKAGSTPVHFFCRCPKEACEMEKVEPKRKGTASDAHLALFDSSPASHPKRADANAFSATPSVLAAVIGPHCLYGVQHLLGYG